jgi:hypothetical protein
LGLRRGAYSPLPVRCRVSGRRADSGRPAQVMSILFEVESLRIEGARNILALLSTNTRRTKVVELSSGTHRCARKRRCRGLVAPLA